MLIGGIVAGAAAVLVGGIVARTITANAGDESSTTTTTGADVSEDEARAIAADAYLFGYPLVTMELTRREMTNAATPNDWSAPMGQFANLRSYPTAEMTAVTTPNADTLYSTAWVDVSKEPYILSVPAMKDRFFMMPMLDAWTEVFRDPGTRTTGGGAQTYAITGPGWKGTLPKGVTQYPSATNIVWILGRIYSNGTQADLDEVHALQDKLALVPLSAYGKPYTPPRGTVDDKIDMKTPVRDQIDAMDTTTYFNTMTMAMKANPPTRGDKPIVERMAKLGIVPGKPFDVKRLAPVAAKALEEAGPTAVERVKARLHSSSTRMNNWQVTKQAGRYGTDYEQRALVAAMGLGANRPEDAVYPFSEVSEDGKPYDGSHKYVLHFDKGQEPPVKGFWSLTMYKGNMFFAANPLNRYTRSSRDAFTKNPDGSVDLYIQKEDPGGDKSPNWLPAPEGRFVLMLRLYWPNEAAPTILDGSWKPPPVKRVAD